MSTKKPLPPPPAPQKKDDGRDRIRAALAGSAARTTESVVGEVLLIDGEFVRLINLGSGKEKLRGMSGFYAREPSRKDIRQSLQMKALSCLMDYNLEPVAQLSVEEGKLIQLLKYSSNVKGGLKTLKGCSLVEKPIYSKLPSMTREQVISLSDRMYSRTLEEMQGELFDDAE
ncbi:TPA: hypothetical protein ACWX8V_002464 [Klebsiella quasipneumoniae]|jgi:hypothetical protein|uniref:hypothetical protein n=1 Tax=Klebsiella pneumoniae complex TaxID=3390273 RepID=UPI000E2CA3B7|nr:MULTISPECIES: hypothetical protein [Klebsiella]HBQ5755622.1 hypothetical protein [Klebsiella pneumoniae subsp. pneumoniae]EKU0188298.1 hypothetical protein [Klebsiella pneumoniae]ELA0484377.1 hypothetical protein [Klebsiella pneumoniae]EMA4699580.1 hypothetical protein [Klebsiella pneumoniae]MCC5676280.1 hypothetical protein [Klebsiella pneumoniae]